MIYPLLISQKVHIHVTLLSPIENVNACSNHIYGEMHWPITGISLEWPFHSHAPCLTCSRYSDHIVVSLISSLSMWQSQSVIMFKSPMLPLARLAFLPWPTAGLLPGLVMASVSWICIQSYAGLYHISINYQLASLTNAPWDIITIRIQTWDHCQHA